MVKIEKSYELQMKERGDYLLKKLPKEYTLCFSDSRKSFGILKGKPHFLRYFNDKRTIALIGLNSIKLLKPSLLKILKDFANKFDYYSIMINYQNNKGLLTP